MRTVACNDLVQERRSARPSLRRRDNPLGTRRHLEVVGGVLLLVVSPTTIGQMSRALTQHELSEDPHDFLATHLLHAAGSQTGSSLQFGAAYLLLHGVVKIVLVTALLRDKIWAYP
jgi:uncharacterized membrane protein